MVSARDYVVIGRFTQYAGLGMPPYARPAPFAPGGWADVRYFTISGGRRVLGHRIFLYPGDDEKSCLVVSRDDLSVRERAVLFALLGEARQVSNPELEKLIGFPLTGAERRRLNDRKLVESSKPGRAFAHELSDAGWRWCAEELAEGQAGRAGGLERAHYLVFGAFTRYMKASGLILADVVAPRRGAPEAVDQAVDVAALVEDGYRALAPARGEFVRLRELRLRLAGLSRPDLDSALAAMFTAQRINLIPQSNQQALSAADRESALRIGGEYKHLISIE